MKGIVVCPQPRAADVGAEILSAGGNAFDAAVATACAQMVVDPFMCGLGGMGSFQFHHAESGANGMIDFHARAGSRVTPEMWMNDVRGRTEISGYTLFDDFRSELGYTSILTPGTVKGFGEVHRRFCTKSLDVLVAPAVALAREGSPIGCFAYDFLSRPMMAGIPGGLQRVSATEECKRIHLRGDGSLYPVGELHRNPDMARTFERIAAEGAESFYTGELGAEIGESVGAAWQENLGVKVNLIKTAYSTYRPGLVARTNKTPGVNICGDENKSNFPYDWAHGFVKSSFSAGGYGVGQELPYATKSYSKMSGEPDKAVREALAAEFYTNNRKWANCIGFFEEPLWPYWDPSQIESWDMRPQANGNIGTINNVNLVIMK